MGFVMRFSTGAIGAFAFYEHWLAAAHIDVLEYSILRKAIISATGYDVLYERDIMLPSIQKHAEALRHPSTALVTGRKPVWPVHSINVYTTSCDARRQ